MTIIKTSGAITPYKSSDTAYAFGSMSWSYEMFIFDCMQHQHNWEMYVNK